jgi:hypothetical protein
MSCAAESLLTNVTREPTGTVMSRGDAPAEVMVIEVVFVDPPGGGVGDGDGAGVLELLLPPHAGASTAIRRTFARC